MAGVPPNQQTAATSQSIMGELTMMQNDFTTGHGWSNVQTGATQVVTGLGFELRPSLSAGRSFPTDRTLHMPRTLKTMKPANEHNPEELVGRPVTPEREVKEEAMSDNWSSVRRKRIKRTGGWLIDIFDPVVRETMSPNAKAIQRYNTTTETENSVQALNFSSAFMGDGPWPVTMDQNAQKFIELVNYDYEQLAKLINDKHHTVEELLKTTNQLKGYTRNVLRAASSGELDQAQLGSLFQRYNETCLTLQSTGSRQGRHAPDTWVDNCVRNMLSSDKEGGLSNMCMEPGQKDPQLAEWPKTRAHRHRAPGVAEGSTASLYPSDFQDPPPFPLEKKLEDARNRVAGDMRATWGARGKDPWWPLSVRVSTLAFQIHHHNILDESVIVADETLKSIGRYNGPKNWQDWFNAAYEALYPGVLASDAQWIVQILTDKGKLAKSLRERLRCHAAFLSHVCNLRYWTHRRQKDGARQDPYEMGEYWTWLKVLQDTTHTPIDAYDPTGCWYQYGRLFAQKCREICQILNNSTGSAQLPADLKDLDGLAWFFLQHVQDIRLKPKPSQPDPPQPMSVYQALQRPFIWPKYSYAQKKSDGDASYFRSIRWTAWVPTDPQKPRDPELMKGRQINGLGGPMDWYEDELVVATRALHIDSIYETDDLPPIKRPDPPPLQAPGGGTFTTGTNLMNPNASAFLPTGTF